MKYLLRVTNLFFVILLLLSISFVSCRVPPSLSKITNQSIPIVRPLGIPSHFMYDYESLDFKNAVVLLNQWLYQMLGNPFIPSASVAVVDQNGVVYENSVYTTNRRLFHAVSFTKTFTALSVLQLYERELIDLHDPISKYFPITLENPDLNSSPITIYQLLTHSSGIPDEYSVKIAYPELGGYAIPLQIYPAGQYFAYSNAGYVLLGMLVEKISDLKLGDYIRANILDPLEMSDTLTPENLVGSGGLMISQHDLAHYVVMLVNEGRYKDKTIIQKSTFEQMLQPSIEIRPAAKEEYRAVSWRVWTENGKIFSFNHAALWDGSAGWIQVFPFAGMGVLFFSDPPVFDIPEHYPFHTGLKHRLMDLIKIAGHLNENPHDFTPTIPLEHELEQYTGTFKSPMTQEVIEIMLENGKLKWTRSNEAWITRPLRPHSMSSFLYPSPVHKGATLPVDFIFVKGKIDALAIKDGYYKKQKLK